MPIYDYRCATCGAKVEMLVRGSQDVPTCPHCGAALTERLPSAPAFSREHTTREAGKTCCGRQERCDSPPCSTGGACRHEA